MQPEEGVIPNLSENPDHIALREALYDYVSEKIPEPNTKFRIKDISGIEHSIFSNDIIVERIEGKPEAKLMHKSTKIAIGAGFTLGALFIAVGVGKLFLRDRPKE